MYKRIELNITDHSHEATLLGDPDGFFSPTPYEERRRAHLMDNPEDANLMDFEETQAMMRHVEMVGRHIKDAVQSGKKTECWWTETGWIEFGSSILDQARLLDLNPSLKESDNFDEILYEDSNQIVVIKEI